MTLLSQAIRDANPDLSDEEIGRLLKAPAEISRIEAARLVRAFLRGLKKELEANPGSILLIHKRPWFQPKVDVKRMTITGYRNTFSLSPDDHGGYDRPELAALMFAVELFVPSGYSAPKIWI
jgi:hypothetical protein